MPTLEASVSIDRSIEDVFDFLTHTETFEKIVPADLKLRLIKAPERIQLGSQFEVQIVGFGLPQNVVYEVTEFTRPKSFVETQVKGPLGRYVHSHLFASSREGHVVVTDRIEFEPPGGFLGMMITAETLKKSLQQGLVHRQQEVKKIMEGS